MNNKLPGPGADNRTLIILVMILAAVAVILTIAYFLIGRKGGDDDTQDPGAGIHGSIQGEDGITTIALNQTGNLEAYHSFADIDSRRMPSSAMNRVPMEPPAQGFFIHVDKSEHLLTLYKDGLPFKKYVVTVGGAAGDKEAVGDMKTPEGNFYIASIENSAERTFDEGSGPEKAYGPWFLRLQTGSDETFSGESWTGIAIHGTSRPEDIGKHASHGCIRLRNELITELKETIEPAFNARNRIYVVVVP